MVRRSSQSTWSLAVVAFCAVACTSTTRDTGKTAPGATGDLEAGESIEQEAVAIVRRAATHVRNAQTLSMAANAGFEVVQDSGQKLEFGSSWSATIQRPDRAHLRSQRRDGVRLEVVMDGTSLWLYSPDHQAYALEPQPGDIGPSLNHMLDELGMATPISDLFSEDIGSSLAEGLQSCYLVGDSTIGGHLCHHVSLRNEYADYQIWVDQGEVPAVRRIVISYREEEGLPQYWVHFTDWDFAPEPALDIFTFQPPPGAERIRLAYVSETAE